MESSDIAAKANARRHWLWIAGIALLAVGTVIRILLRDMSSLDLEDFLIPWFNEIKSAGGMDGLGQQVGDYNILYQTLIALFTYLPIKAVYAYKLFSCIFDVLLVVLCAHVVYKLADKNKAPLAVTSFGLVYLSPIVILNSS